MQRIANYGSFLQAWALQHLLQEMGHEVCFVDYTRIGIYAKEIMAAADVLLTKPGGLTSTEAAVANVPIVHVNAIPGCETCNAQYFSEAGMSLWAKSDGEAAAFAMALARDGKKAESMRAAQRRLVNPFAAEEIAHAVMQAAGGDAP